MPAEPYVPVSPDHIWEGLVGPEQGVLPSGLGRFSEDKGKQAQADFFVLGGPFAHLGYEKGKNYLSLTGGKLWNIVSPRNLGLLRNPRRRISNSDTR